MYRKTSSLAIFFKANRNHVEKKFGNELDMKIKTNHYFFTQEYSSTSKEMLQN
jgi:hypothetical protein